MRKYLRTLFFAIAILSFSAFLFTQKAEASVLAPGQLFTTCGDIIAAGTYYLNANIATSTGACINITSTGVTIYATSTKTITGSATSSSAIDATGFSFNVSGVVGVIGKITADTVTFNGSSYKNGKLIGNAIFNDSSRIVGLTWTTNGNSSGSRLWTSLVASMDGTKIAAIDGNNGYLYVSSDSGLSWNSKPSAGQYVYSSDGLLTMSADGSKIAAVTQNSPIYISNDGGDTWESKESSRNWMTITSSADGSKIAAIANGLIYVSVDSGDTWSARSLSNNWGTIKYSADGTKIVAGTNGGYVYFSDDDGISWTTNNNSSGYDVWENISISSDGLKIVASTDDSAVYLSQNGGLSWNAIGDIGHAYVSLDGTMIVARGATPENNRSYVYTSFDDGLNWSNNGGTPGNVFSTDGDVAFASSDGSRLVAYNNVFGAGYIYTSVGNIDTISGDATFTANSFTSNPAQTTTIYGQTIFDPTGGTVTFDIGQSGQNNTCYSSACYWYTNTSAWNFINSAPVWNFYGNSFNNSQIYGDANFYDTSYNNSPVGKVFGDAVFNDTSFNESTISENVIFNDNSYNTSSGIILSNADVYFPVAKPLLGTVGGLISYYNYPGFYYNNATGDGDWNNVLNWWTDANFTVQATSTPSIADYVYINGLVATGTASTQSVVFSATSTNNIDVATVLGATFTGSSTNSASGTIIGTTTFIGDLSNNEGKINIGWAPRDSVRDWKAITSSADGSKLAAIDQNGRIYTSTDSGFTWTPRDSNRWWNAITSSADGTKLVATVYDTGLIYASTDSGVTWAPIGSISHPWASITSSADGTKLAAVDQSGQIYTSTNSGANWTARDTNRSWRSITSSADGNNLAAVEFGGQVYVSTDSGVNWDPKESNREWSVITSSADGQNLVTADGRGMTTNTSHAGYIYVSNDGGTTWATSTSAGERDWSSIAVSADGTKIVAVAYGDKIYVSNDGGVNWAPQDVNRNWAGVTISADGSKLAAVEENGKIYTFSGDDNTATVIRRFTSSATTTRDFTSEGGRDNWIVEAYNSVVDLTNATYSRITNIFKAFANAVFIPNINIDAGGLVTPGIVITSPTTGDNIKWSPSVDWGNSQICSYKMDTSTEYTTVDCENDGSDIPRPTAGSHTLWVKGVDAMGNLTEKSVYFTYDNTKPVYTSCGTDLLDESTRPYYYLTSDVYGNCNVMVDNVEIRGSLTATSTVGYTIHGNVLASALATGDNGFNITLKYVGVTGYVTTVGAPGASGIDGGNGGNITIATSTTGAVYANGGDSPRNGGSGGAISVNYSYANASSTTVYSTGGNSTTCGYGGSGGDIDLIDTIDYVRSNNKGADHTTACSPSGSSGSNGGGRTTGTYTPPNPTPVTPPVTPPVVNPTPAPSSNNSRSASVVTPSTPYNFGSSTPLILPVANIKPLELQALPTFGDGSKGTFSFESAIFKFLFDPLTESLANPLSTNPEVTKLLTSIGLYNQQDLLLKYRSEISIPKDIKNTPKGLITLSANKISVPLYIKYTGKSVLSEQVSVIASSTLTFALIPTTKEPIKATFNGASYTFKKIDNTAVRYLKIEAPAVGVYTLNVVGAPLPFILEVKPIPKIEEVKNQSGWEVFRFWK